MAVEDSVAQDQIRAFVERIERMEEEKRALSDDIKAIYQEARGNGFDVKVLRRVVNIRKQDANDRMEQEALLELYMSALGMVEAPPEYQDDERDRLNSLRSQVVASLRQEKPNPIAALKADPAMAIVDVANLKSQPSPTAEQAGLNKGQATPSPVESEAAEISTPDPVANVEEEANGRAVTSDDATSREADDADRQRVVASGFAGEREPGSAKPVAAAQDRAPLYAEPGVIVWETFPPEGVERGAISMAFGTMGQDTAVIADELERGAAQPIVKKGNVILDGWARFMAARNMRELDGSPMAYPVVQYDGADLLVDVIKLNVDGRILNDDQKRKIAANLARQEPSRRDDIYKAFEIFLEPV